MKKQSKWLLAGIFCVLFLALIALVRRADVAAIGPEGTSIGLSHLNAAVRDALGVRMFWYDITELLGALAILVAGVFALTGLWQLIRRRSLFKVDRGIWALAALYVAVIALYVFFEKVIINYRPILMPGCDAPEASFPSSHTMLVCTILGSAAMQAKYYIKNASLRGAVPIVCAVLIGVTVLGRLLSGVHWFTDILGGVLISVALLAAFSALAEEKK